MKVESGHSGIWGSADDTVLNIVHKKENIQKIPFKNEVSISELKYMLKRRCLARYLGISGFLVRCMLDVACRGQGSSPPTLHPYFYIFPSYCAGDQDLFLYWVSSTLKDLVKKTLLFAVVEFGSTASHHQILGNFPPPKRRKVWQ